MSEPLSVVGTWSRHAKRIGICVWLTVCVTPCVTASTETTWVPSWRASMQGPYPVGSASAQPDLRLVFPPTNEARDQSFRTIVRPDIWAPWVRIRLSNVFGSRPVTFDGAFVGLQMSGAAVVDGTNRAVRFGGKDTVTVPAGGSAWSDPVELASVARNLPVAGRKLAVSFYVLGSSGPMTRHAKALTTSYLTLPDAGKKAADESDLSFPASTTSWFFLDAIDVRARADTQVIVALGDSITDGTGSTLNGDDRWPDVLSRRLHRCYGDAISVINAGIGGNQIVKPDSYDIRAPTPGGPSAAERLERDVLDLSNVSAVIWLEGINDLGRTGNATVNQLQTAMTAIVRRIRAKFPRARIVGGTLTTALGSTNAAHGSEDQDAQRRSLNEFIRSSSVFDVVVDFDRTIVDPQNGRMHEAFVPDSTTGGVGDRLHPNRLGYAAMASAIDLHQIVAGRACQ